MEKEIKNWGKKLFKFNVPVNDPLDVAKFVLNYFKSKGLCGKELWQIIKKVTPNKVEFEWEDSPKIWDFLQVEMTLGGSVEKDSVLIYIPTIKIKFVCDEQKAPCKQIFLLVDKGYAWGDLIKELYNNIHRFPFELSKKLNSLWSERDIEIYDFKKFFESKEPKEVPIDFK